MSDPRVPRPMTLREAALRVNVFSLDWDATVCEGLGMSSLAARYRSLQAADASSADAERSLWSLT